MEAAQLSRTPAGREELRTIQDVILHRIVWRLAQMVRCTIPPATPEPPTPEEWEEKKRKDAEFIESLRHPSVVPEDLPAVAPVPTLPIVRPGSLEATTSDANSCDAVASPPPDDFIARRNRERDERRRQDEADKQERETIFLAPKRQLRPEWDAAWMKLWESLSPVWRPWQEPGKPDGEPDVPTVACALKQVAAAILRHDELSRHIGASKLVSPVMPHTLAERLAWVESHASDFVNLIPVCSAVSLIHSALSADADQIAERVRMVLADDDARPAFGWLLNIRDCLWPAKQFMEPAEWWKALVGQSTAVFAAMTCNA